MITVISDVHIKEPEDEPYKLMVIFLKHPTVIASEKVILLGDIFDFVVGGDDEFAERFSQIFKLINALLDSGKEVHFIEGNHDFHLERFFKKRFNQNNFYFSNKKYQIKDNGNKILLCHGDDIEIDNPNYKIYSFFIRSLFIKVLAEYIVPFGITKMIGDRASAKSRKKNFEKYESMEGKIRQKFRNSAEMVNLKNPVDFIISGHSHVKDEYVSDNNFTYLNNGYVPKEKTFLKLVNGAATFVSLVEPSH